MQALPVDDFLAGARALLQRHRALVLTAAPGAGKTTRLPPALIDAGPVILLQPRRVAARAVARRIAEERAWTLGREIGWQIRFERRFSSGTQLLVVTEGILTARLQQDPLLSPFNTIVLDEFHERSVHADIGLALARQAWLARDDLRLVVMSATLEVERVARFLDDCPVLTVPGTLHRLDVEYAPAETLANAVAAVLRRTAGQILCFLPGAREIDRARADLAGLAAAATLDIVALHGSLPGDAQDEAIRPVVQRRVILATNIAETSLTVPGVSAVVDSGLVKVARYDAARGVDSLTLERVSQDSADQRAGRAARLGPGLVRRLWSAQDRLRPHREPEIGRVDLAGPVLDLIAWGARIDQFDWFEAPPADRVAIAIELLRRLGAVHGTGADVHLTDIGRQIEKMPLHPRLARILIAGRGAPEAAAACALLSEPSAPAAGAAPAASSLTASPATTSCDLLPLIDRFDRQPPHIRRVAEELQRLAVSTCGASAVAGSSSDDRLRQALFAGYGDRLGKRRAGTPDRVTLASGHGAVLGRESGVRNGDYLIALDVVAAQRDGIAEARIHAASEVDRQWIVPTSSAVEHVLDDDSGVVRAARIERYGALVLGATPVALDLAVAAQLRCDGWLAREPDAATAQLIRRARFAGIELDVAALAGQAAMAHGSFAEMAIEPFLDFQTRQRLAAAAPLALPVPSGRSARLEYAADGTVSAAVKLQELFGLAESPTLGPHHTPVTFHLLAPNGRPVQTTRDLRSFWSRTYPEVRKELRGRYPRHPWPEDPWTAPATHRTRRAPPRH